MKCSSIYKKLSFCLLPLLNVAMTPSYRSKSPDISYTFNHHSSSTPSDNGSKYPIPDHVERFIKVLQESTSSQLMSIFGLPQNLSKPEVIIPILTDNPQIWQYITVSSTNGFNLNGLRESFLSLPETKSQLSLYYQQPIYTKIPKSPKSNDNPDEKDVQGLISMISKIPQEIFKSIPGLPQGLTKESILDLIRSNPQLSKHFPYTSSSVDLSRISELGNFISNNPGWVAQISKGDKSVKESKPDVKSITPASNQRQPNKAKEPTKGHLPNIQYIEPKNYTNPEPDIVLTGTPKKHPPLPLRKIFPIIKQVTKDNSPTQLSKPNDISKPVNTNDQGIDDNQLANLSDPCNGWSFYNTCQTPTFYPDLTNNQVPDFLSEFLKGLDPNDHKVQSTISKLPLDKQKEITDIFSKGKENMSDQDLSKIIKTMQDSGYHPFDFSDDQQNLFNKYYNHDYTNDLPDIPDYYYQDSTTARGLLALSDVLGLDANSYDSTQKTVYSIFSALSFGLGLSMVFGLSKVSLMHKANWGRKKQYFLGMLTLGLVLSLSMGSYLIYNLVNLI